MTDDEFADRLGNLERALIDVQIGDLLLPENTFSTWDVTAKGRDVILRVSEKDYNLVASRLEQKAKVELHHSPYPLTTVIEVFEYKSWKRIGVTVSADGVTHSIVLSEGQI